MLNDHRADFDSAVTFMSTKITQAFPLHEAIGGRKRKIGGGYRKISQAQGGRYGGRGGRGGRNNGGRGGNYMQKVSFNNVDCSDVTRKFSSEEWDKIGNTGRSYVNKERSFKNSGPGGGRGGRGGREGRGGRGGRWGYQRNVQEVDSDPTKEEKENDAEPDDPASNSAVADPNKGGKAGRGFGRGAYKKSGRH